MRKTFLIIFAILMTMLLAFPCIASDKICFTKKELENRDIKMIAIGAECQADAVIQYYKDANPQSIKKYTVDCALKKLLEYQKEK